MGLAAAIIEAVLDVDDQLTVIRDAKAGEPWHGLLCGIERSPNSAQKLVQDALARLATLDVLVPPPGAR